MFHLNRKYLKFRGSFNHLKEHVGNGFALRHAGLFVYVSVRQNNGIKLPLKERYFSPIK